MTNSKKKHRSSEINTAKKLINTKQKQNKMTQSLLIQKKQQKNI
jgi:hypothetical protein